jgi:hypothetical protein
VARRIFLHVGTTKSGTTFLQRVLWGHRDRVREAGLLLPGGGGPDHYAAALDVREEPTRSLEPESVAGAWTRLVEEMAAWDGDALVTHELFAPARADQVERAVAKLDAEVHVVLTARDLARQIPSEWQEHLKHRSVLRFPEFVHQVRTDSRGPFSPNGYYFWEEQDVAALASRWGCVPADRIHVVTVPQSGAGQDLLWTRFTSVIGIDAEGFDLESVRSNQSLAMEQAELVRRLNAALGDRLPLPGPYTNMVKGVLAHRILAGRPGADLALTAEDHAYAHAKAGEIVAELTRLSPRVVGSLDELVPAPEPAATVAEYRDVVPEAVLVEAVEALAEVLERLSNERARSRRLRARLDDHRTHR